jgi:hypothetical protein
MRLSGNLRAIGRSHQSGYSLMGGQPMEYLYIAALEANARFCRRQGLPGLPWCAGVPVRRACCTGTVSLAVG